MKDIQIIFCSLLPALRPHIWAILASLGITVVVIGSDLLQPIFLKILLDAATVSLNYKQVLLMLCSLLGVAIIRSLVSYWEGYARSRVGEAISRSYRKRLFEHVLHLPFPVFHETQSGVLENRIMNDCGTIGRVYVATQLLPLLAHLLHAIALLLLLLTLSWQIGLATILVFPFAWLLTQKVSRRSHTHMRELRSLVEQGQGFLQEVISCLREVRATCNEAHEIRRWDTWLQKYGQIVCSSSAERKFVREALGHSIHWFGLCIVFGWGGFQLLQHQMTIGTLLALSLYVQQLYTTLTAILAVRIETTEAVGALQAINDIFSFPQEQPEKGKALEEGAGRLEFVDVHFSYIGRREGVDHISFTSHPGQITGIIGTSGSGKSTLINLCMRFYELSSGKILLDGQDISKIAPHAIRRHIGLVSQDIPLWNTTIRENLLYGVERDIPWEEVMEICKHTCVHSFVELFPQGYNTLVGARGTKLSGGQRQRIALTRALLRDPKILLLDEATSALDALTEAAIITCLRERCAGKTRILITHRLSTVQSADHILVMKDGQITEEGSPSVLSQQKGLYTALYQTQQLGELEALPE